MASEYRVVVLPGLAGCEADWREVTAGLEVSVSFAADALPGLADDPSLDAIVASAEVAVAPPGEPVVVVAHSMGSMPAEVLARRAPAPAGLLGIVLVDPSAERDPSPSSAKLGPIVESLGAFVRRLPPVLTVLVGRMVRSSAVRIGAHRRDPLSWADVDAAYGTPVRLAAGVRGYGRYLRWALELRAYRAAGPARVPVRALIAADSAGRALRDQRWLADQLSADVRIVPGTRHLIYLDRPDAVIEAIRSTAAGRADRNQRSEG